MNPNPPLLRTVARISLFVAVVAVAVAEPMERHDHGDPTDHEQYMLELVNTARADPAAEALRLRIGLNDGIPAGSITPERKQPLAFHPILLEAARGHSDWMLQNTIFSHDGIGGSSPTERAAALGYSFGVYENIGHQYTTAVLNLPALTRKIHDSLFRSVTGHRQNLMEPSLAVAGLGLRTGKWGSFNDLMITQKFSAGGETVDSGPFIVGVAYRDLNRNRAYDPGEGIGGIEVRPGTGTYYAVTSSSGGFAIPLVASATNTANVTLPFAVNDGTPWDQKWAQVKPYDDQFRAQSRSEAPDIEVPLMWSGGSLDAPLETVVVIKRPLHINYRLTGTDGGFYERSMITTMSARADLLLDANGELAGKSAQSIKFSPLRPVTYVPGRMVRVAAKASSRLPVTISSARPEVAVENGGKLVIQGAGTSTITARQNGDEVFEAAPEQERELVVNKAKQTITFRLKAKVETAVGSFVLDARASSGLPVAFESTAPEVVSIAGNVATIHGAGSAEIIARQSGNANYLEAKPRSRKLRVQ